MGDTIQRKSCLTIDREYKSGMSKVFIEVSFFSFDSEFLRSTKHKRKVGHVILIRQGHAACLKT